MVNKFKVVIRIKPVLTFYGVRTPVTLQSDAPQSGVGAPTWQ